MGKKSNGISIYVNKEFPSLNSLLEYMKDLTKEHKSKERVNK